MKIAVYHNQPSGGARRALAGFGRELARAHRVDVFTLTTADQRLIRDEEWAASVTRMPFETRRPVRMGYVLNDLRRLRSLADLDRANAQAAALIDAGSYDVALVDACRFTYAPQVLAHLRTPAAYYCHHGPWRAGDVPTRAARSTYEETRRLLHAPFELAYGRRLAAVDRAMVLSANSVLVNSLYTKDRVWREYGVDAEVCPPGVAAPSRVRSGDTGHVLTVGALEPHKGHELVIQAIGRLPGALRPRLHLVANDGSPAYRQALVSLAGGLGVDLTIRVRIGEAALEREYREALLFGYGARFEPLGLAPLEAMAHGLAVVAVGEGGVRETVIHGVTGLLVPADPDDLAASMASLLGDPELRRRMEARARAEVVANWSWARRATRLEEVLRRVAATRSTASVG